ncbi:hypothetical protein CCP2SC5_140019 [Azospirillaceae bacterium]
MFSRRFFRAKTLAALLFEGIVVLQVISPLAAQELRVFSYPLAPMTYEENGYVGGPLARLVMETLRVVDNVSEKPISIPVARLLAEVESGAGVGFPLARDSRREPAFEWIVEIYQDSFGFATLSPTPRVDTLEQARALNMITVNNGSSPLNFLRTIGQFNNLDLANSEIQNGLKLYTGRVDAWFSVRTGFRPIARVNNFDPSQLIIGAPVHAISAWMIGSKTIPRPQIEAIRKRFAEIKISGFYDKIMQETLDVEKTARQDVIKN